HARVAVDAHRDARFAAELLGVRIDGELERVLERRRRVTEPERRRLGRRVLRVRHRGGEEEHRPWAWDTHGCARILESFMRALFAFAAVLALAAHAQSAPAPF